MESPSAKTPLLQPSWLRVIIFVLLYLVVNLLAYKFLASGIPQLNILADAIATFSGNPGREFNFILLGLLTSFLLSVVFVVLFTRLVDRRSVSSLGFEYRGYLPDGVVGFLLPLIIIGTVSLILYFTKSLEWTDISFTSGDFLNGLFLMIVVAVGEELVFRGYIQNNLMQSLNRWLALAISAALFALMHSNNPGVNPMAMINLFAGGLLLGLNYVFTRNLWFSILLHTGWNFLQGPVLGFPVSGVNVPGVLEHELKGDPILTGGAFGLEASLLTGMLLVVSILILFFVYRWRAEKDPRPSI